MKNNYYINMHDNELNTKLAQKINRVELLPPWDCGTKIFSPCTSRDDLAVVVEYIDSIGRGWELHCQLFNIMDRSKYEHKFFLTDPPRIIAEACLEVLEG